MPLRRRVPARSTCRFWVRFESVTSAAGGVNLVSLGSSANAIGASFAVRRDASDPNKYNLGLFSRQTFAGPVFLSAAHSPGSTHLIVAAYSFVPGAANDVVKLWVDPPLASFGGTEPPPSAIATTTSGDLAAISQLFLWQRDSTNPPLDLDELIVATAWAEVTPPDGPVAQAENRAAVIRREFSDALWAGYQGQPFASDVLMTSSAQLNTYLASLPSAEPGVWRRIRLASQGDWSNASSRLISIRGSANTDTNAAQTGAGGYRDYYRAGGGVLIEPDSGMVTIESQFVVTGFRGLHVRNITFARSARFYSQFAPDGPYPMALEDWCPADQPLPGKTLNPRDENTLLVTRSNSFPELPVVIVENCRIGTGYHPTDGGNSLAYCTGFRVTGGAEQISILNCQFRGVQTGITTSSVRWLKIHRNDLQLVIGDAMITLNAVAKTGPVAAVFPDGRMNIWRRLNTVRNMVDECDKRNAQGEDMAFWAEHADAWQVGTGGDTGDYRVLSEYNVSYMDRQTYADAQETPNDPVKRETGGTQGSYNDDSKFAINLVTMNEINANNTGNAFIHWNAVESYLVKSIGARASGLAPSAVPGVNSTIRFTIDPIVYVRSHRSTAYTGPASVIVASSIFERAVSSADAGIVDGGNNTIACWRRDQLPTAASVLHGTFQFDGEGRTIYSFGDTGSESVEAFRRNLWLQLKPQAGNSGPDDPALWPLQ